MASPLARFPVRRVAAYAFVTATFLPPVSLLEQLVLHSTQQW